MILMLFFDKVSSAPSSSSAIFTDLPGIRRAILSGDIDQALRITGENFPTVLVENPDIVFRLKCRKWIELISKTTDSNTRKPITEHDRESGNGAEKAANIDDDFVQDMELDADTQTNGARESTNSDNNMQHDQLLQEVMLYGQELHREFQNEDGDHAKALQDIFSLVAYNDPKESVHGHLLDPSGRDTVAEELNSAILGMFLHLTFELTDRLTHDSFSWAITFCCPGNCVEAGRGAS